MFCPTCANPIDAAQPFCPSCGSPVTQAPGSSTAPTIIALARPQSVTIACLMLFASVALSVLSLAMTYVRIGNIRPAGLAVSLVYSAIWVGLTLLVMNHQSWARILIVVALSFSLVSVVLTVLAGMFVGDGRPRFPIGMPILWVGLAIRVVAVVLLFKSESNAWFRGQKT